MLPTIGTSAVIYDACTPFTLPLFSRKPSGFPCRRHELSSGPDGKVAQTQAAPWGWAGLPRTWASTVRGRRAQGLRTGTGTGRPEDRDRDGSRRLDSSCQALCSPQRDTHRVGGPRQPSVPERLPGCLPGPPPPGPRGSRLCPKGLPGPASPDGRPRASAEIQGGGRVVLPGPSGTFHETGSPDTT